MAHLPGHMPSCSLRVAQMPGHALEFLCAPLIWPLLVWGGASVLSPQAHADSGPGHPVLTPGLGWPLSPPV